MKPWLNANCLHVVGDLFIEDPIHGSFTALYGSLLHPTSLLKALLPGLKGQFTCTGLYVVMKGSIMWYPGPLGEVSNAPPLKQTQTNYFVWPLNDELNISKEDAQMKMTERRICRCNCFYWIATHYFTGCWSISWMLSTNKALNLINLYKPTQL